VTRHFISISDTPQEDLERIYELARLRPQGDELAHVGVSLIFEKPSLRTRASSVSAVQQLGGHFCIFTKDEIGLDVRESSEDVARTLAQTSSIVAARVFDHGVFARMMAATKEVSFINLLSDYAHPAQAVADVLALADFFGQGDLSSLQGKRVAYVGDATNVTRSLASSLIRLGVHVVVGAPDGYQLSADDVRLIAHQAAMGGSLTLCDNARQAAEGANALYTDSWISMGLEAEAAQRREDLKAFQVNSELLALADPTVAIMHCLPAHRGEEITDEVLDSAQSLIWSQVHHRTTAMLGILRWIQEGK
jgi:ornithine carbamoyltransferase